MKNMFNKKQFNNICVLFLIVLFSCLIIYQIYLAINNYNKFDKNYSKLIEGLTLTSITAQGQIECTSNTLPSNIYTVVTTDISNIQLLYNEVTNIGSQAISIISKFNSNPNNTSVTSPSLNTISSFTTTLTESSNASDFCTAINTNLYNINLINENIEAITNAVQNLPDGQTEINNAVFQNITTNTAVSPCNSLQPNTISSICTAENTNINNINVLSANTTSLNNVVTNLQSTQSRQLDNQNNTAMAMSKPVGLTSTAN
jgi:hypothetical protein